MNIVQEIEQVRNAGPLQNSSDRIANILLAIYDAIPTTLPANDVPSWAKQPEKPTYRAEEIEAEPAGATETHNKSGDAHKDIRKLIENGGLTKAVRSITINGELVELDMNGNVNIVISEVAELQEVSENVSALVELNISNRLKVIELSNPDIRVSAALAEAKDGARTSFTLDKPFISGSTQVWVNGIKLTPGLDYTETSNVGIEFIGYAPKQTTDVQILLTENI